jgi:tetratricopeptide (TPR) repeat protein
MSKQPKRPVAPSFNAKVSDKNQAKFSLEKLEEELQAAFEADDDDQVLELLDSAPSWVRNQPEFMLFRASALLSLGLEREALRLLLDVERKNPRLTEVYVPLAVIYFDREWPVHALQAAKHALSDRNLLDEARDTMEQIVRDATAELQSLATKFGISMETVQQGALFHEKALSALEEDKLMEVDLLAQKAIKLIPDWNPPHNNRAQALYFTGRSREAIDILESVLAREADNVFALHSLVTFYYGLDQIEQSRVYASRLEALIPQFPADGTEIEHVITALALVEDTPALWKIAKKYLDRPADALFGRSWHCLAVAAARSEKWKNALDLMYKANEENELSPAGVELLDQLETARRLRPPRVDWMPPEYPGVDLYFNPKIISELEALLHDFSSPITPSQQRKLESYLQRHPYVKAVLKRLLWEQNGYPIALDFLANLNQPDTDAEVLRFALSQTGTQEARTQAILALIQVGRYTGPKMINLWNEELREWREVVLNTQRIGDIPLKAQPKTIVLMEKARRAKKPEEAISLLRKAVEIEPTCAMAIFDLGATLAQNGNVEEGEALIYQSVSVDPGYTYGHASIALSEANEGHEQAALDHLKFVFQADSIATDTAVIANLAWSVLALQKQEVKTARKHFDLAAQLNPEHRLLETHEAQLKEAEKFGFILEFQRESAARAHQKLLKTALSAEITLHACLEIHTKEMLAGSAKFLHISSSGKKGELAARLAKNLLDVEFLRTTLEEGLAEKEREALRWVLQAGGVRPWNEFARTYGDDLYESTFWNYHEPKSIPGRLRMSGLLYSGTLDDQQVVFIPPDIRTLLLNLLQ